MKNTAVSEQTTIVRTGADRLLSDTPELIRNKRIGILTNHTGRLSDGRLLIDAVAESGLCTIKALYGPEHGIAGDTPDGKVVDHIAHPDLGVPIFSLYGKIHKPTRAMLEGIDVLVCDIQDVGARFYTFISTIALMMEAAAEQGIPFVILDRPNPIRGLHFDGPIRTQPLKSFVGWMPIPVTHGMTIGELARLWNEEGWIGEHSFGHSTDLKTDLEVVPVDGWRRSMWFDETGLPWIAPSPNMQSLDTAVVYPGLCFVEGTSLSEGRGTLSPFQLIGAPWVDPEKVLKELAGCQTAGVTFSAERFVPQEIPGMASQPKYEGEECRGIRITTLDRNEVRPVCLGIAVLAAFKRAHPKETEFRHRRFDILTGSSSIRQLLDRNATHEAICDSWIPELERFGEIRSQYLLYKE